MLTRNAILQNRYQIIDIIGQGGMGAVYQAIDQRLGNTVALKQTFFTDEELGRAFEREARLLASLCHPSLPWVSDHFVEGDGQFLVMEFIPGDDLAKLLKREASPFDCDQVLEWGYQLLDVLDYLHSHQPPIIHRDIKPQNLKLTDRGRIILLDFGLAKGAPQLLEHGTASSLFGYTLNYAPLEQIQHTGTEPRSDLYSVGATLYHLLTAKTPLGSLSRAVAIVSGEPDPLPPASEVNPLVPPAIAQVISQAMALRPENRHATAARMLEALRQACRRPSAGYLDSGRISTAIAPSALKPRSGSVKKTSALYPMEAVTQPMVKPMTYAAPDTVAMTPAPTSVPARVNPLKKFPLKLCVAILGVALFFATMPHRSGESAPETPAPPVTVPPRQPRPSSLTPSMPNDYLTDLPRLILPADGKLIAKRGVLTLRWTSVPGAVNYKVEVANSNFSRLWIATETSKTVYVMPHSSETGYVRLITISATGRERTSVWWTINPE